MITVRSLFTLIAIMFCINAYAAFGPQVVVDSLKVNRIYQGVGPIYATFSGPTLAGCSNNGGYLKPSWTTANGGVIDQDSANRMLSVLLYAKAQKLSLEVRYKLNSNGTGWDNCSIEGVYLH